MNLKKEAGVLTATELRTAVNVLFDEVPGQTTKRWGIQQAALLPSGLPAKFGYRYIKSDGSEIMLLSDGATLYATADLITFTQLITGLAAAAYQSFETADGRCWITNGVDATMWYDGTNLIVMDRSATGTTAAGTDQTHIVDSARTEASGYWNNRKVVITSGTYKGMEGTVTNFNAVTNTLSISGFNNNPGAGVTYAVGLIMPKGKIMRYDGSSLFIGATSENAAEIRFSREDDPNTGEKMSIDNPRAWPANYQLAITQDDGDQVWTFSPKYRNRIMVTKSTAIYRLDPDPVFVYTPVLVSQEVGCRYQDSWATKDDILYFMGSERSGQLDLYVTDMVGVRPRHKDGRLMPAFEDMYRAEPVYKRITRASADQFNTGEQSTLCKISEGRLECREIDSESDWNETTENPSNISKVNNQTGGINILGIPAWPTKYDGRALPEASSPVWTVTNTDGFTTSLEADAPEVSVLKITKTLPDTIERNWYMQRNNVFDLDKNCYCIFKAKTPYASSHSNKLYFTVSTGKYKVEVILESVFGFGYVVKANSTTIVSTPDGDNNYHTYAVLILSTGAFKIFQDGIVIHSGTAAATTDNNIIIRSALKTGIGGTTISAYLKYAAYHANMKDGGDIPNTIPTFGTIEVKLDFKRTPDSFGKIRISNSEDYSGQTAAGTDATHIVDNNIPGANDMWNGRLVTITSGTKKGETATVTDYDSATHTLTVTGLSGSPGTGETYEIARGGTLAIETQSSADDATYSALAALTNGQQPAVNNATPLARYLKLKLTLTRADYVNGPEINKMIGGFLWRMQAALVGANITAWRNLLAETTVPAGSSLVIKIRLATTATTPTENDWGAWKTITTGQNIGTVLGDALPPAAGTSRWLDVKVEGGPTSAGDTPNAENITMEWQEGSLARLLLTALVHKKRYYMTGISAESKYNNLLYVLDTNQAWTTFGGLNINRMLSFRGQIYGLSATDAKIYLMEVEGKYTDGATNIDAYLDAGALDGGNQRFELASLKVGAGAFISEVQVLHSYDGITFTALGTLSFSSEGTQVLRVPRGRIGKRHFIRLRNNGAQNMAINMLHAVLIAMPEEM